MDDEDQFKQQLEEAGLQAFVDNVDMVGLTWKKFGALEKEDLAEFLVGKTLAAKGAVRLLHQQAGPDIYRYRERDIGRERDREIER